MCWQLAGCFSWHSCESRADVNKKMFFEMVHAADETSQSTMFGFAGFGALGNVRTGGVVPVGTQLRLQANIQDNVVGVDPWSISESALERVSSYLRQGGYRILKRWFDYYAGVSFEVELTIPKTSLAAIEDSDFYNSVRLGLQAYEQAPYNVRSDVLFDPTEQTRAPLPQGVPPTQTTTPAPRGTNTTPAPDDKEPKGFFDSIQEFFDKKFGFLGGTISGAALILLGVGALFVASKR